MYKNSCIGGSGPSAWPAPSHSLGALRDGRQPGDQGKTTPSSHSAAATASVQALASPTLSSCHQRLLLWASAIRGLPVPRASPGWLAGLRGLGETRNRSAEWLNPPGGGPGCAVHLPPQQS
uniref:Uncharacterized protein n=1 Tax=Pipistrellus kuhlii TaxID=59472 RepID=A0A7J7X056_PIPKU|nr:hypothetical protein mPipKuh1_010783 [Pipistrellus kuhlii]